MGRAIRLLAVSLVSVGLVALTACEGASRSSAYARPAAAPTAVDCADAPQLRQRALDDRGRREETNSDQEKIVSNNRATFYESLAIIADLKCQATFHDAEETLRPAFDAARKAEGTNSFYEKAVWWGDAAFIATQAIPSLMKQLPALRSK